MRVLDSFRTALASGAGQNRAVLWAILLILTATLLSFPVHLVNEYRPIQAPHIFDNLALFGVLFSVWMLLLLLLAFTKKDEGDKISWETTGLAALFGTVFVGFWVVITPNGSFADGISIMGHVRWLVDEGSIPVGHANLTYFDFPGMHLLVSALSEFTGMGIFASRTLFLLFNAALFAALLHVFFVRILKSNRTAFLGVLLVMIVSVMIVEKIRIFTPGALGFTLLAALLVMLTRSEARMFGATVADRLLTLIIFAAMTVSYFATSFLLPLILLGMYLVLAAARDKGTRFSPLTIALLLTMIVSWTVYWTWHTFPTLTSFLSSLGEAIAEGEFLRSVLTLGPANVGGALPAWASIIRIFWFAFLAISSAVGLYNLLRIRRLSHAERIVTGGLVGVVLLTLLGTFATQAGAQFTRFLLYAPLFSVPILLLFLQRSGDRGRKGFAALALLVLALAPPTFLSTVNTVDTDAVHPYEHAAGEFLEDHTLEDGESHVVYRTSMVAGSWAKYYVPDARIWGISWDAYRSQEDARAEVRDIVEDFTRPFLRWKQKVFLSSPKSRVPYQHRLGMGPDDPVWEEVNTSISGTNMVFNSGHIQIYARRPPV